MSRKPRPEPDDLEQSRRFAEAARELEADESGLLFEQALKGVALPKEHRHKNDNQDNSET